MSEWFAQTSAWLQGLFSADAGLWGLFGSAFLSATLLPGSSEVVMIALLTAYPQLAWSAFAVALAGNLLGCVLTYFMGAAAKRGFERFQKVGSQISPAALARIHRLGPPALFLSFLPLVGDALVLAAGWLRLPPLTSLLWTAAGKGARYLLVVLSVLGIGQLAT